MKYGENLTPLVGWAWFAKAAPSSVAKCPRTVKASFTNEADWLGVIDKVSISFWSSLIVLSFSSSELSKVSTLPSKSYTSSSSDEISTSKLEVDVLQPDKISIEINKMLKTKYFFLILYSFQLR